MQNNLENLDLFDRWLLNSMDAEEQLIFDQRLKEDKAFAEEFRLYLITVKAFHQEAEQDDVDFGMAMKNIDGQDLKGAIGIHVKRKKTWLRPILSGIAAAVVIGIPAVLFTARDYNRKIDYIIADNHYQPVMLRGEESYDEWPETLDNIPAPELRDNIENFQISYDRIAAEGNEEEQKIVGVNLAMAYLKLHNRKEAREILAGLAERYSEEDPDFADYCRKLIKQIQ